LLLRIRCPFCDEVLRVAESHLQGGVLCPACKNVFTVSDKNLAVGYDSTGETKLDGSKGNRANPRVVKSWVGVALILLFTGALLWFVMPREDLVDACGEFVGKLNTALNADNEQALATMLGPMDNDALLSTVRNLTQISLREENTAPSKEGTRSFICVGKEEDTQKEVRLIFTFEIKDGRPVRIMNIRPAPEEVETKPAAKKKEESK